MARRYSLIQLLGLAAQQNFVTPAAASALAPTHNRVAIDTLGIDPDNIKTEKVTIVTVQLDDSGSMRDVGGLVRECYARCLQELKEAGSRHDILVGAMTLGRGVIQPYVRLQDAKPLTPEDYTPFYDQSPIYFHTIEMLRHVVAKQAEVQLAGISARTISLILTDGANGSDRDDTTAQQVKEVVEEVQSRRHSKIWGIGFESGARNGDSPTAALLGMGLKPEFVKSPSDPSGLIEAFREFSRATSAVASQS